MRSLAQNSSMLIAIICLLSMAKAQGLNPLHALKDRGNNGTTLTNYFLSFVPNLDMSLLNRAHVLSIKQYHTRHGIRAAKSSSKGNAIYYIIYPYCYAFPMISTHILAPVVYLNTHAECVARQFAGRALGRPLVVMHVMCGITRTAWV